MVVVVVFVIILHHQFYGLQGTQLGQGMCILLLGVEHKWEKLAFLSIIFLHYEASWSSYEE